MWCDDNTASIRGGFTINHIGGIASVSRTNNPALRRNRFSGCAKNPRKRTPAD
jgi:hypothetical protein